MDSYSFISENGNVREIIDLTAKAKNEEQDERIEALESKLDIYSETETATNQRWTDGKVIYRRVIKFSPGIYIKGTQNADTPENQQTLVTIGPVASVMETVTRVWAIAGTTRAIPAMLRNWGGTQSYVVLLWTTGSVTSLILEYTKKS